MERARERERRIGGAPAWLLVHAVVGREGPGAACTCARGEGCPRPGKHPVARLFPHGAKDAVALEEALGMMGPGHRLAAVLQPLERVLDADTPEGAASLWRCWPEVERAWAVSVSPRGFHVWQEPWPPEAVSDIALVNRSRRFDGGDVKTSGYVVWPDGRQRRWLTREGFEQRMRRRFPGTGHGGSVILGQHRRQAPRALGGGQGSRTPGALQQRLLSVVQHAEPGNRNNALNWAGWRSRELLGGGEGWDAASVAGPLYATGVDSGLDSGEVERTVRSGLGLEREEWHP